MLAFSGALAVLTAAFVNLRSLFGAYRIGKKDRDCADFVR